MKTVSETFDVMGGKLTHTLIDLDYIIHYSGSDKKGWLSSRQLKDKLDTKGSGLFVKFVNRAYRDGDNVVCKLRSGIKVSFSLR